MKKLLVLALIALSLGGCATISALQLAVSSTVTPTQAIVAANAFDAIESGATAFLTFCKANANVDATCIAGNRRNVIQYTRAGRAARNQMETYVQSSSSIPAAVYNTVVTAVTNLKATPAANYAGAQ